MAADFRFHNIEIWGTVISIKAPVSIDQEIFNDACSKAQNYFQRIDELFSIFKPDSEISQLRSGRMSISNATPEVKLVWNKCLELRELTQRAFDPWAVPGGFDPSGYVKGWAAQDSLQFFADLGVGHIQINAGGDVVLRGGVDAYTPSRSA